MNIRKYTLGIVSFAFLAIVCAQSFSQETAASFDQAAKSIQQQLEASVAELNQLREQVAEEKIPLSRKLNELESQLSDVRAEYQQTTRLLDSRTLDLSNLRTEIQSRKEEATYLSNLLSEYIRNFETRLHISEIQRYKEPLEKARLAPENNNLSKQEVYEAQAGLLQVSLNRIEEALSGTSFEGTAVDPSGLVKPGQFILVGPAALFQSEDGENVGTAEQRLGSLEPAVIPFENPEDAKAASNLFAGAEGMFPLDPTLGNAHKIEETKETFIEHVQKGGPVMYPIFALAGAALLVAIFKWLAMAFVRTPSQKKIRSLLHSVAQHDVSAAKQKANSIGGPVGRMLSAGIENIKAPRELIEEVMYEKVLTTRLKLQRFLPFIAISAASAPLLGLLGTVTGIINTFKLITVFGSGDVKTLSGGISEALITTEFGLIVAIPSLLLHAFLSRRARGIIDQMEKAAVAFVNQVGKTPFRSEESPNILGKLSPEESVEQLQKLDTPKQPVVMNPASSFTNASIDGLMDKKVLRLGKNSTVSDAIGQIRDAEIGEEVDAIYIVDDHGKYIGHVPITHLITRPENAQINTMVKETPTFIRIDAHHSEIEELFSKHNVNSIPVLDHDDKVVGRITRQGNGNGNGNGNGSK